MLSSDNNLILSFNILDNDLKVLNIEGKFSIENDFYPLDLKLKMNNKQTLSKKKGLNNGK